MTIQTVPGSQQLPGIRRPGEAEVQLRKRGGKQFQDKIRIKPSVPDLPPGLSITSKAPAT